MEQFRIDLEIREKDPRDPSKLIMVRPSEPQDAAEPPCSKCIFFNQKDPTGCLAVKANDICTSIEYFEDMFNRYWEIVPDNEQ